MTEERDVDVSSPLTQDSAATADTQRYIDQVISRLAVRHPEAARELREREEQWAIDAPAHSPHDAPSADPDQMLRRAPRFMRVALEQHLAELDAQFSQYAEVLTAVPSMAQWAESVHERLERLQELNDADAQQKPPGGGETTATLPADGYDHGETFTQAAEADEIDNDDEESKESDHGWL